MWPVVPAGQHKGLGYGMISRRALGLSTGLFVLLAIFSGALAFFRGQLQFSYGDALLLAVEQDDPARLRSLLGQADANVQHPCGFGRTLLHEAGFRGKLAAMRFLLTQGADLEARDLHGQSPLIIAARAGQTRRVELLLEQGADPNAREQWGRTALHWAAREGHASTVQTLLAGGADPRTRDMWGCTAETRAVQKQHQQVLSLLKKAGQERRGRGADPT